MPSAIELESFPFQCEVAHGGDGERSWLQAAAQTLVQQAKVGTNVGLRASSLGYCTSSAVPKNVRVGLKVSGFKSDKRLGRGFIVSAAAFHSKTKRLVSWTGDLEPVPGQGVMFHPFDRAAMKKGSWVPIELDASAVARLRRLADSAAAPAPSKQAAWSHDQPVTAVAMSVDGSLVASAASDGKLCVWDARSGAAKVRVAGMRSPRAITFSPNGEQLALCYQDAALYRTDDGKKGRGLECPRGLTFRELRFSRAGTEVAGVAASRDGGMVLLWDAATGKALASWQVATDPDGVAFTDTALLARGHDGKQHQYYRFSLAKLPTGKPKVEAPVASAGKLVSAFGDFSPDGKLRLSWNGNVVSTELASIGKVSKTWTAPAEIDAGAWSPSGKLVILGAGVQVLRWDPTTGKPT